MKILGELRTAQAAALIVLATMLAACASTPRRPPAAPRPSPSRAVDLSGEWLLTTTSQLGATEQQMLIRQSGAALSGTLTNRDGVVNFTGAVQGVQVTFAFELKTTQSPVKIDYRGVVEGDAMRGKAVFGAFAEGVFVAKRK